MSIAWSHSRLDTFKSCPRQFEAKFISKSVVDPPGTAQLYGTAVHLAFEEHQRDGKELPEHLRLHQPFMDMIREGELIGVERKVALNKQLQPCGQFDKDVWWRGVIDHHTKLRSGTNRARCIDYKTGKQHNKMDQLKEYALYAFAEGYDECEVMYYWTQTRQMLPRVIFHKLQFAKLLDGLLPDLTQYREAHKTGIWQPRPNGLCKRYCPVFGCEFNGRSGPDG